jgi:hypothetical protein
MTDSELFDSLAASHDLTRDRLLEQIGRVWDLTPSQLAQVPFFLDDLASCWVCGGVDVHA